jgi:tetratricopeptide (TPR) repeat protein
MDGRREDAREFRVRLEKMIDRAMRTTQTDYKMASGCERFGDFARAKRLFDKVLARGPKEAYLAYGAHYHLGSIFFQEGNYEKSRRHLERCLTLEDNHVLAHRLLGQLPPRDRKVPALTGEEEPSVLTNLT